MVFALSELIDMAIMTLAVGYIFMQFIKKPVDIDNYDPLKQFKGSKKDDFWYSVVIVAPAIILHELGHKFVAMGFGLEATFHAAYTWLGIGVLLTLFKTGIIFFVPAFVSISGPITHMSSALTAFAGPAVNLLLFVGSIVWLKKGQNMSKSLIGGLQLSKKINLFLFFFNMIPLGFFDGAKVFSGLYHAFF